LTVRYRGSPTAQCAGTRRVQPLVTVGAAQPHDALNEVAFNLYTTWAVWAVKHLPGFDAIAGGMANPGFNDPREPERWAPRLKLLEEIFLTRAPEVADCPLLVRQTSRLASRSATVSRMAGTAVLRYGF
jgi:hypothetical protein